MRDALGQVCLEQNAGDGLAREGKFNLRPGQNGAALHVRGDCLLQCGEALGRVVKIGDGIVQARRGQVGKLLLEAAERAGRLERLPGRRGCLIGVRMINEAKSAPGFSLRIHVPVAPVLRRNQLEHAAGSVGLAGCLRAQMRRHALDILHHGGRIAEDIAIDVLQDVACGRARPMALHAVGIVDVAVPVGRDFGNFTVELELGCHGARIARDEIRSPVMARVFRDRGRRR